LPAETAPEVIIKSVFDFKLIFISFLNFIKSLSRKIFFSIKLKGKFSKNDFK